MDEQIYRVLRADYLRDHPICECDRPECKKGPATDIHHRKGRGKWLNVVEFFLAVSRECHRWIEIHPKEAKALGLSLARIEKRFINPQLYTMNKDPKDGALAEETNDAPQTTQEEAPTTEAVSAEITDAGAAEEGA